MDKINFQNGILVAKAKVTINGTVYEVEPEEYEGETPLSAEILNEMQDNIENAINTVQSNLNTTDQNIENLTTYSTEEKVVGTWIDGKPIYQKTFVGNWVNNESITLNDESIDNFIDIVGWANSLTYWIKTNFYDGNTQVTLIPEDKNRLKFMGNQGGSAIWNLKYFTIRYTKTTD